MFYQFSIYVVYSFYAIIFFSLEIVLSDFLLCLDVIFFISFSHNLIFISFVVLISLCAFKFWSFTTCPFQKEQYIATYLYVLHQLCSFRISTPISNLTVQFRIIYPWTFSLQTLVHHALMFHVSVNKISHASESVWWDRLNSFFPYCRHDTFLAALLKELRCFFSFSLAFFHFGKRRLRLLSFLHSLLPIHQTRYILRVP